MNKRYIRNSVAKGKDNPNQDYRYLEKQLFIIQNNKKHDDEWILCLDNVLTARPLAKSILDASESEYLDDSYIRPTIQIIR